MLEAGVVLRHLLGQVHVQRTVAGSRAHRAEGAAWHGPHRMNRDPESRVGVWAAGGRPDRPPLDVAVGEPALNGVRRLMPRRVEPTGEIARVEQGEPDAGP